METCGVLIQCWDYLKRPCVREKGHKDNGNPNCHNPFSNNGPAVYLDQDEHKAIPAAPGRQSQPSAA